MKQRPTLNLQNVNLHAGAVLHAEVGEPNINSPDKKAEHNQAFLPGTDRKL